MRRLSVTLPTFECLLPVLDLSVGQRERVPPLLLPAGRRRHGSSRRRRRRLGPPRPKGRRHRLSRSVVVGVDRALLLDLGSLERTAGDAAGVRRGVVGAVEAALAAGLKLRRICLTPALTCGYFVTILF